MCPFPWVTQDGRTWRAQDSGREFEISRAPGGHGWTLYAPGHNWHDIPSLELAKEVAALAADVLNDDHLRTSIYRVVTFDGGHHGDEFGADCDEDALAIIRLRRHAGALPLGAFSLRTVDGRTVGAWSTSAQVYSPGRQQT